MDDQDVYSAIGEDGFRRLIDKFYSQVKDDDLLARLYPQDDFAGAEKRLRDFLIFRFGGPARYIEERGHPRLRMRHAPFPVDAAARDRWLMLMRTAMRECAFSDDVASAMDAYFEAAAAAMINRQ